MGWGVEAEDATVPGIHCLPVIMVKFLFKEKKRKEMILMIKQRTKNGKLKRKKLSDSRCRFSVICNTIFLENCGKI